MKCAIMQPTYLPWAGYFHLVGSVDRFVLLDDVQFARRSWQSRNRLLLNGCEKLVTVPVCKVSRSHPINVIGIDYTFDWRSTHLGILEQGYRAAPFGPMVLGLVRPILEDAPRLLVDLNERILRACADIVGIRTPMIRSSALGCGGTRSEHLAQICRLLDCSAYVSPFGSKEYLERDGFEERYGIKLEFSQFIPRLYPQLHTDNFVSSLSFIDVLAHLGPAASLQYLDIPQSPKARSL
jgi:hypothetical protein